MKNSSTNFFILEQHNSLLDTSHSLPTATQNSELRTQNSLVCTVKNEADNIAMLLDSMLAQSRRPDEIVINDCGSDDGTDAIVERYIAAGHSVRLVRGGFNICLLYTSRCV